MEKAQVVKWKGSNPRQWHYGVVVDSATDATDGPWVEVEYTHSVPASNQQSGRRVRVYGVHKVYPV